MKTIITFIIILLLNCFCVYGKSYLRHALYRAVPKNQNELNMLKNLHKRYDVNYWRYPGIIRKPIEFTVGPESETNFVLEAKEIGLNFTVIFNDVQSLFDKQAISSNKRSNFMSFNWEDYFRLQDIYAWMLDLNRTHPKEVFVESIGKTEEKREILSLKLDLPHPKLLRRSIVIIEGGIHAREWISPAFITYMIVTLLQAPQSKDAQLKLVARSYIWYFVPVLNPDGYEYSHTQDRLWRKNRNDFGVDLNRNFAYYFGKVDCSPNPDGQSYCGSHAFSELESSAMAKLVRTHCKKIEFYLAFHSYGQYMIIPYAHTNDHVENYDEVKEMGDEMATQILKRYGTTYSIGTAIDTVGYPTSGASMCWVKNTCKIPYVATFELRDSGYYGFALPPRLIKPTCLETMDGLISFLTPKRVKIARQGEEKDETSAQARKSLNMHILIGIFTFSFCCLL